MRASRWSLAALLLVLVATAIGRGFVAVDPDIWDGQVFSFIGQKWLEGQVPYVDLWDNKAPGIFALLAAVFWAFPRNFLAVAILEGLLLVGASAFSYLFLRRSTGDPSAAAFGAVGVAVTCNVNRLSPGGLHTEIYALLPMIASMYCFARGGFGANHRWSLVAGIASGLAVVISPKGLSPALAQFGLLALLVLRGRRGLGAALGAMIAHVLGILVVLAPFGIYFAVQGGLGEAVHASLLYNFSYGSNSRPAPMTNLLEVLEKLRLIAPTITAASIALFVGCRRWWRSANAGTTSIEADVAPLLALWLLVDLFGLQAGGRNYYHYYFLPALSGSVAAGYLLSLIRGEIAARELSLARGGIAAMLLGPMLLGTISDAKRLRWEIVDPKPPDPIERVAAWLQPRVSAGETLFSWDYSPSLHSITNLDAITPGIDAHHLYDSPAAEARFGPQILQDLEAHAPDYVVDRTLVPAERAQTDIWYARFREFVDAHYVTVWSTGQYQVYRPRTALPEPTLGQ